MEFVILGITVIVFAALGYKAQVWSTLVAFFLLVMLIMGVVAYRENLNAFSFICPISAVLAFYFANRAELRRIPSKEA